MAATILLCRQGLPIPARRFLEPPDCLIALARCKLCLRHGSPPLQRPRCLASIMNIRASLRAAETIARILKRSRSDVRRVCGGGTILIGDARLYLSPARRARTLAGRASSPRVLRCSPHLSHRDVLEFFLANRFGRRSAIRRAGSVASLPRRVPVLFLEFACIRWISLRDLPAFLTTSCCWLRFSGCLSAASQPGGSTVGLAIPLHRARWRRCGDRDHGVYHYPSGLVFDVGSQASPQEVFFGSVPQSGCPPIRRPIRLVAAAFS